jgi:hypothetical protein
MENMVHPRTYYGPSASNDNDIPFFEQTQDCVGNVVNQTPRRWVKPEQFIHGVGDFRNAIFRHEPGEAGR